MTKRLVFDIEADGFLLDASRVHCLVVGDADSGKLLLSCAGGVDGYPPIEEGLRLLAEADEVIGHNIVAYDLPVLRRLYGFEPSGRVTDTFILTRLLWPDVAGMDYGKKHVPTRLIGSHSLEAWGFRLGILKDMYDGGFSSWNPEMQQYCEQDVRVTVALFRHCCKRLEKVSKAVGDQSLAIDIEHSFAALMARQEEAGVPFDEDAAAQLYADLAARRAEVLDELRRIFPAEWRPLGVFTPRADNRRLGYIAGAPFTRVQLCEFRPDAREDVVRRLAKRGIRVNAKTATGRASLNDEVLAELGDYPEVRLLVEYYLLSKTIAYLAEGSQAWMKCARNGRIHGRVITPGTPTRRCRHASPNLAQVPSGKTRLALVKDLAADLGRKCRALFKAPKGWRMVGCDASGLELRCLAHYLALYDGGEYARIVTEGDVHWANAQAGGLAPAGVAYDPEKTELYTARAKAKNMIYCLIYGGGDTKLGLTVGATAEDLPELLRKCPARVKRKVIQKLTEGGKVPVEKLDKTIVAATLKGAMVREALLANLRGYARLVEGVQNAVKRRKGILKAVDGGALFVRKQHAALNTLLQSAGAIAMKMALIVLEEWLVERGWKHGEDYVFVLNIHDEIQALVREDKVDEYLELAPRAITEAGKRLGFRCRLDGEARAGGSWAETH